MRPPKIISTAEALYPIHGIASGTLVLDAKGSIDSVKVVRDVPSPPAPSVTAVKKWRSSPAKFDGYAVSIIPVALAFLPPSTGPRTEPRHQSGNHFLVKG